ncbi:MAG: glycosyltransferase family 4 protein [Bacteroidales bacterium]|nr:glycosyltransferase family 4 protein [Bacteroidales bacterium]
MKICHLTSVHPANDVRIFYKECTSLKKNGYEVIIIANGAKNEIVNGINIIGTISIRNRFFRILIVPFIIYFKAIKIKAVIYHFHDPELVFCGIFLKLIGKKVIFDIHENIGISILDKRWINKPLRKTLFNIYNIIEKCLITYFDKLIVVSKLYNKRFPKKSVIIKNYPIINIVETNNKSEFLMPLRFIYVGVINEDRCVFEMLKIISILSEKKYNIKIDIIGEINGDLLKIKIDKYIEDKNIKDKVSFFGRLDHSMIFNIMQKSHLGFALLKPTNNYLNAIPTKIFEYMMFGLPVICSDFSIYDYYIKEKNTGICIDIKNIDLSVNKIESLINNIDLMKLMSENGMFVVRNEFNWESEEKKLLKIYQEITNA